MLTDQAVEAINGICAESEVGPDGGLRISGVEDGDETALDFALAPAPEPGDEIVREGGAVVFLDATAAAALADKTLDAEAHGDHFHFSLDDQVG